MNSSYLQSLFSVAGKNVLITGGSRGIGLMIAEGFFKCGANVCITSRDENACKLATESVAKQGEHSAGGSVQYIVSNVSSREGCRELAQRYVETYFFYGLEYTF